MNNYPITKDYYNYFNNQYNHPTYTEDANAKKLHDPYTGFIKGNMFPNLYNPYKNKPFEIKPLNEQANALTSLNALGFAVIDIALYLDIYPDDRDMLTLYNQYRIEHNKLSEEYQQIYGPLSLGSNATNTFPWKWIEGPWPWENK